MWQTANTSLATFMHKAIFRNPPSNGCSKPRRRGETVKFLKLGVR